MDIPNEESWSFFESLLTEKPPTLVEVKAAVDVIDNYLQLSSTADIVHLKKLLDSKFEKYLDHDDESPGSSKQPGNKQASTKPPFDALDRKVVSSCKSLGKFGKSEGQYSRPCGLAINADCDIVVADSDNHRVQVFYPNGHFKFEFGSDDLVFPNGVAVFQCSGEIVVTEMSPHNRITIFDPRGNPLRRFGENVVKRPQLVAADGQCRIVVVDLNEGLHIFDQLGTVLNSFKLPRNVTAVSSMAVNDREEIFVCDVRNHCVEIFSYDGVPVGRLGGIGITNFPRGVAVYPSGNVLVVDNNRNMNFTIFTAPFGSSTDHESTARAYKKKKIMRFYDFALAIDGSLVFATEEQYLCQVQLCESV